MMRVSNNICTDYVININLFYNITVAVQPSILSHKCAGLSLLRPMYYDFPESPEAYMFEHQVSMIPVLPS